MATKLQESHFVRKWNVFVKDKRPTRWQHTTCLCLFVSPYRMLFVMTRSRQRQLILTLWFPLEKDVDCKPLATYEPVRAFMGNGDISPCTSDRNPIDWRLLRDFACGDNHSLLSQRDDWAQAGAETMPHTITQPCWERIKGFVVTTHSDTGSDRSLIFNLTFTSVEEMSSPGWFLFAAAVDGDMSSQDGYEVCACATNTLILWQNSIRSSNRSFTGCICPRVQSMIDILLAAVTPVCESVIWRQGVSWGCVSVVASE